VTSICGGVRAVGRTGPARALGSCDHGLTREAMVHGGRGHLPRELLLRDPCLRGVVGSGQRGHEVAETQHGDPREREDGEADRDYDAHGRPPTLG
jgi:hypothetical protein